MKDRESIKQAISHLCEMEELLPSGLSDREQGFLDGLIFCSEGEGREFQSPVEYRKLKEKEKA